MRVFNITYLDRPFDVDINTDEIFLDEKKFNAILERFDKIYKQDSIGIILDRAYKDYNENSDLYELNYYDDEKI